MKKIEPKTAEGINRQAGVTSIDVLMDCTKCKAQIEQEAKQKIVRQLHKNNTVGWIARQLDMTLGEIHELMGGEW